MTTFLKIKEKHKGVTDVKFFERTGVGVEAIRQWEKVNINECI